MPQPCRYVKPDGQLPLTYTLTKADGTFILPLHQADDSLFVHVSLLGYKAIRQKNHSRDKTSHPPRTGNLHSERGRDTSGARLRATRHDQLRRVTIHQSERRSDQRRTEKTAGSGCRRRRENLVQREKHQQVLCGRHGPDRRAVQPTKPITCRRVLSRACKYMENHQPIRALQKKLTTEDIAINLKLKDNFRDRWMGTLEGSMEFPPFCGRRQAPDQP